MLLRILFATAMAVHTLAAGSAFANGEVPFPFSAQLQPQVAPAYSVGEIRVVLQKSNPPRAVIDASGLVTTTGWSNARLEPRIYVTPPRDGMWDIDLVADAPPPGRIVLPILTPISAQTLVWENPPPQLEGFRIHAATNSVEWRVGDAATASLIGNRADYGEWIGKRLVRRGEPVPQGEQVVREEDIPPPYVIVSPDMPITDMMFNPNRLRIYLDERGTINAVGLG